ncbi:hypothetical protein I6I10_02760 [Corynebacterium glucuronolyticum]|uniref:Uncharacterized protein n=1 Tax=Corynebacterium glucuronolyticum TaxID=39791 RepID=A0A7T4EGB8_9CORY|nr:hypothetical protein [Corynebacterium glucuronolyticum]MCT1442987.1 hypothetical protein [Corynebacterium glucuronolyticum]QQB46866.1 hypothetical protein I6I10_02760 [Corynebacterium glucuronolyticum]WKD64861.1 hypothetical protein CGLUCO_13270 [Corynebacterium glucuronolyticum DSM 44120]SMB87024.1 hypothetical protein SAMN05660745_01839 [Corynebacterium glucuronolyticum]
MKQYATACRALAGEFMSRRLIALTLLLCMAAVPLGRLLGKGAGAAGVLTVTALLTGLTAFSNAAMWARDGRLNQIRVWPVTDRALARCTLLVATVLFLVEFGIPQVVLHHYAGQDTYGAVIFSVFTYAACWAVVLHPQKHVWVAQFAVLAVIAGVANVLPLVPLLVVLAGGVAVGAWLATTPPRLGRRAPWATAQYGNYFVVAGIADQRVWVNGVGIVLFAAIFIHLAPPDSISLPLGLCLPLSASVLTTMLSRDPATHDAVRMLGRQGYFYGQYWVALACYFTVMCGLVAVVSAAPGRVLASIIPVCALAAGLFVLLEARWPLRKLKTEKEILKHPRRYGVVVLGGLAFVVAALSS